MRLCFCICWCLVTAIAVESTHVFLPQNYRSDMGADMEVVKRCAARAVEQKRDIFEFTNNQWNDESCVLPTYEAHSANMSKRTFFEKFPSQWSACPCDGNRSTVELFKNKMTRRIIGAVYNDSAPLVTTVFDRLPNNVLVSFTIFYSEVNFELVIYGASTTRSNCGEGQESVRVRVTNQTASLYVNRTLHSTSDKILAIKIAKVRGGNGYTMEFSAKNSDVEVPLPTLGHALAPIGRFNLASRTSGDPYRGFGQFIDTFHYQQLFNLFQFNVTLKNTSISDCDMVCEKFTEWASIRSEKELQLSLEYIRNKTATIGESGDIPIALLRKDADHYMWNDEAPLSYANWENGRPSDDFRKYVVMNTTDGTWRDVDEDYKVAACLCRSTMFEAID